MQKVKLSAICPLCKKKGSNLPDFPAHLYCKTCKLAWLKHFPKAIYDDTYYQGASSIASKLFTPITLMFNLIRNVYVGLDKKKLWIDVGAGDGGFLKIVRAERKIGVDISPSARKIMKGKGLVTMTEQQFLEAKNLDADVISFWHMLEHVPNPWDYLNAAKKNLAKNGRIVIGVPNIDCLEYYLFRNKWFHTPKFHLYENSPRSIDIFLRIAGFKTMYIDYWSPEHHLPTTLQSFINFTSNSQGALHRFIRRGHDYEFHIYDAIWSIFWMTVGAPLVIMFWIIGALTKKSSTIVVVAKQI